MPAPKPVWAGKDPDLTSVSHSIGAEPPVVTHAEMRDDPVLPGGLGDLQYHINCANFSLAPRVQHEAARSYQQRLQDTAKNMGQFIRERMSNPDGEIDFLTLQGIPETGPARKVFLDALQAALPEGYDIADADKGSANLTIFDSNKYDLAEPVLALGENPAHQEAGNWFNHVDGDDCFLVANMNFANNTSADDVKADYEDMYDDYIDEDPFDAGVLNDDRYLIFTGRLGQLAHDTPDPDNGEVSKSDIPAIKYQATIFEDTLDNISAAADVAVLRDFQRRDAATYQTLETPGATVEDYQWTDAHIEKVLKARGEQCIRDIPGSPVQSEFEYAFDGEAITFYTNGAAIDDATLGTPNVNKPEFHFNILKELFRNLKADTDNYDKAKLPDTIRYAVPVNINNHWQPLIITLEGLDPDKLDALIQRSDIDAGKPNVLTVADIQGLGANVTFNFIESIMAPDRDQIDPGPLAAIFGNPPQFDFNNAIANAEIPLLQRGQVDGVGEPDAGTSGCGIFTAEQMHRALNFEDPLEIDGFPNFREFNNNAYWDDAQRAAYARRAYAEEQRLRREFAQLCGAGANTTKVQARSANSDPNSGNLTKEQQRAAADAGDEFTRYCEQQGYEYTKGQGLIGERTLKEKPRGIMFSEKRDNKDGSITTTCSENTPETIWLMALKLKAEGCTHAEIQTNKNDLNMVKAAFVKVGFDPKKLSFAFNVTNVSEHDFEQKPGGGNPFAGMMGG